MGHSGLLRHEKKKSEKEPHKNIPYYEGMMFPFHMQVYFYSAADKE